jgi:hypothetical protein
MTFNVDDSFPDCRPDSIRNTGRGLVSYHASLDLLDDALFRVVQIIRHFATATGPNSSQNPSR